MANPRSSAPLKDKDRPPQVLRIAHVGMVVEEIETALAFWQDVLGLPLSHVEDVPDQESAVAFLPLDGAEVELIEPTSKTSGVARYLQKRGPGIHHVCLEVDDLDAMLERLKKAGMRLIQEEPVIGTAGKKMAFLHPQSTHGVLVELYQRTPQEAERHRVIVRGLVDRARAEGQVMSAAVRAFLRRLGRKSGDPPALTRG